MTINCSVFIATSLDGFIARRNGDIDWLAVSGDPNTSEDYGYKEFLNSVDTVVMGRNTYELALSFKEWPYEGKKVVVLSSRAPHIPDNLFSDVVFMSCSPVELIRRLSKDRVDHVYVDGGRTIQGFLNAGLIHDMTITRIPILIGDGIPLFGELAQDIKFRHVETKTYMNGFVQSKYRAVTAE